MVQTSINTTVQTTLCLIIVLLFAVGCDEDRLSVDVSNMEVDIKIERWDSAWFDMSAVTYRTLDAQWRESHPDFYKRYVEDVLSLGTLEDSNLFNEIRRFATDATMLEVHETVQEKYKSLSAVEAELTEAWKHYIYYFPNRSVPIHIAIESGFNVPLAVTENTIGIPLEMYLGGNAVYYDYLQIPLYLRSRMDEQHLPVEIMKAWLETEFLLQAENPSLLDEIIHGGKRLYCLDAIFPATEDSLKINYSATQLAWAEAHEENVWAHFIDKDILFSTEVGTIAKFTRDGPFTVDLVKESPARMGYYVGLQIVKAYMSQQETIDLEALMNEHDARKILKISKYKPS